ncbi:hypothetical protein H109_00704 [Trichophyton interdigitale MR816]|uniref:Uncharacterized protein n=1 Tax=Trichophyton interdigitale (strain MR816) TaxID=1215338 RepID=A0A059JIN3_TRIIM|nr:hypothetical protein H109_00704 [Trichophyton interdigitale MR816]
MAPAADMVVDETKRLVGNRAGLGLLQTLQSMQQHLASIDQELKQFREEARQYSKEAKQFREEARQFREEARERHIMTWMLLRSPLYKRNAVAHGGSILVDLDILRFLTNGDASEFSIWTGGFESIYGMPYSHCKLISRESKMVQLADARADLKLLDIFEDDYRRAYLPKCDAIIKLWKAAIDNGQDPEGVFGTPAVAGIMRSFSSAQSK